MGSTVITTTVVTDAASQYLVVADYTHDDVPLAIFHDEQEAIQFAVEWEAEKRPLPSEFCGRNGLPDIDSDPICMHIFKFVDGHPAAIVWEKSLEEQTA